MQRGVWMATVALLAACQATPTPQACVAQWHSTLPVVMRGALAVVPAAVNGQVVGLGLDTGAQTTTVTPELVASLDLRPDPGMSALRVSGMGGNAYSQVVALDSLRLGGVTYRKIDVFAASLGKVGRQTELPVAGLVGEDLLSRYEVGFDIGHRAVSLYSARGCASVKPPWSAPVAIPLRLSENNHLLFPVELDGQPMTAMLDSGSASDMVLERGAARLHLGVEALAADRVLPMQGVGERLVQARLHRFASLLVAGEQLRDVQMLVLDAVLPGVDLILGMPFLRERQVFISHETGQMFVRPVRALPLAPK